MSSQVSIRVFNDDGINQFEKIVYQVKTGSLDNVPDSFLFDENYSETLEPIINIDRKNEHKNKKELVPWLVETMNLRSNKLTG